MSRVFTLSGTTSEEHSIQWFPVLVAVFLLGGSLIFGAAVAVAEVSHRRSLLQRRLQRTTGDGHTATTNQTSSLPNTSGLDDDEQEDAGDINNIHNWLLSRTASNSGVDPPGASFNFLNPDNTFAIGGDGAAEDEEQQQLQQVTTPLKNHSVNPTKLAARGDNGNGELVKSKGTTTNIRSFISKRSSGKSALGDSEQGNGPNGAVLLSWSGVSCSYAAPGPKIRQQKQGEQAAVAGTTTMTLCNSFGALRAGEVTAIMGPSGAGKSTLLDILGGRKTVGTISGTMNFLGQSMRLEDQTENSLLRNVTAFVPQELAFFPMQTPEEAVLFVACLKHGPSAMVGPDRGLQDVHRILKDVGLHDPELYTRPIGGELAGGVSIRGLSGGERKRLALACALAMKTKLLMLDEITSGLDSENAISTMQLVKRVCRRHNVAAAVVIHQPNGYIFGVFDQLILLSNGHCVFSHQVSQLHHLYEYGFRKPMPSSMHELPLDLLRKLRDFPAANDDKHDYQPLRRPLDGDSGAVPVDLPDDDPLLLATAVQVSFLWKLRVVFQRNLSNHYVRNLTNLMARLLFYSICSILAGCLFYRVGLEQDETVVGAFTFIMLASYLLPFASIPVFVHDKHFFLAERSLGLYSPWIYCICQGVLELWVLSLAATIETVVAVPMIKMWNPSMSDWESFLINLAVLMASGLLGSGLVLFFSVLMPSQDLAFLACSGSMTAALGLSGGFVPFPSLRDFIAWMQWLSPCKYSLQGMTIAFFQETYAEPIIGIYGMGKPATVTSNIYVLFFMYAIVVVATMVVLSTQRVVR